MNHTYTPKCEAFKPIPMLTHLETRLVRFVFSIIATTGFIQPQNNRTKSPSRSCFLFKILNG